jgi:hypothetical protein
MTMRQRQPQKKSQLFSWPWWQKGMGTFLPEDAAMRALI